MLDPGLAALTMGLPDRMLRRGRQGKRILRKAARRWLPACVFAHPKTGFSIPLHRFQNAEYRRLCRELLLDTGNPGMHGLFQTSRLGPMVRRGLDRMHDASDLSVYRASHQVWALMQLAAWIDRFKVGV